jgi:hypothetical protein
MRVCYFIQSHKNPEQVCRLVRSIKISSPSSQVLISHDFSTSYLDLSCLGEFSGIDLIKRNQPAARGDSSILKIYLNAINWLFENNSEFDWLICLSGQDYPTQPVSEIEDFLYKTEYDAFMGYWNIFSEDSFRFLKGRERNVEQQLKRYYAQYVRLPRMISWLLKKSWATKIRGMIKRYTPFMIYLEISLIGLKSTSHPFNDKFLCYRGWHWNTLSRKCVRFLKDYLQKNPEVLKYYSKTISPEESIVQTVLVNSKQFNICNDDKRYIDYPAELYGHARVLTVEDYSKITTGDFHFARNFDLKQDSQILDMLDAKVLDNSVELPEFRLGDKLQAEQNVHSIPILCMLA